MEPMNCVVRLVARPLRGLERRAVPDRRPGHASRRCCRPQARAGEDQHALRGRQLRPPREPGRRLRGRGRVDRQGAGRCRQARVPVKLVWTREDDMKARLLPPAVLPRAEGRARRAAATSSAWQHRIVGQSIVAGTAFEAPMVKNGVDATSVEGASNLPYDIPNLAVDLHSPNVGVPVLWWRSVGSTHTAFSTETFIDELAARGRQGPGRISPRAARQAPAPSRRARPRGARRPAGASRSRRARRARSAAAASPCTSRSAP